MHYQRWLKHGDPGRTLLVRDDPEGRFWSKVAKGEGCWPWTAGRDDDGYGVFTLNGKHIRATRYAWFLSRGEWPADGVLVCHECDNPPCVRPDHLWLGSNDENMADCTRKGRRPTGERNGARIHPESRVRGQEHHMVRHDDATVRAAVVRYQAGGVTMDELAAECRVHRKTIGRWVRGVYRDVTVPRP